MAFKDTDKILVNRDGVDYQADIGPLMGGGDADVDLSDYVSKTTGTEQAIRSALTIGPANLIRLQADGVILTLRDAIISGLTVGRGRSGDGTNTAVGSDALKNVKAGRWNTAVGQNSLASCESEGNTAVGRRALPDVTTGEDNLGLGGEAMRSLTTGSHNIAVYTSNGYYDPVFDPKTEDNRLIMGHRQITHAYVKVAWSVTSDARDKTDFAPVPYGLDFVKQLQPTAYRFKAGSRNARNIETNELIPVTAAADLPSGPVLYGFKAQDILALEGDNPVIIDNEDPEHLKYRGEHLVPVLVNAIKEQQVLIDALTARLDAVEAKIV